MSTLKYGPISSLQAKYYEQRQTNPSRLVSLTNHSEISLLFFMSPLVSYMLTDIIFFPSTALTISCLYQQS